MPEYREIIQRVNLFNILHRIYFRRISEANDLYFGQMPILEYVRRHDRCTQREVADGVRVSPPSVAMSVKRMQRSGLLEKQPDPNDLRVTHLSVTPKGLAAARECRRGFDRLDKRVFAGFTSEECAQLCGYFDRLVTNLSSDEFSNASYYDLIMEEKRMDKQQKEGMPRA